MTAADRPSVTDNAAGRAETTTATDEDAAKVLDDVIQHLRRIWTPAVDYTDEHEVIDTAEVLLGQALPRLLATARTRPTETTTEWGVRDDELNGHITYARDEDDARFVAKTRAHGHVVVRREVTAWTEAGR